MNPTISIWATISIWTVGREEDGSGKRVEQAGIQRQGISQLGRRHSPPKPFFWDTPIPLLPHAPRKKNVGAGTH